VGKKKMLTCQNSSCKKNFEAPLKTLNLQTAPTEIYNACPYCLTKIKEPEKSLENLQAKVNQVRTKETLDKNNDNPIKCHFHQGYLSERTSKENIPDECLVCKDILECMLRKMRE
jgi:hypothetical protein